MFQAFKGTCTSYLRNIGRVAQCFEPKGTKHGAVSSLNKDEPPCNLRHELGRGCVKVTRPKAPCNWKMREPVSACVGQFAGVKGPQRGQFPTGEHVENASVSSDYANNKLSF
ncbi:Hypothetical protein NTJ_02463 [Nesidiocoris tenuis]|uniref:Uncharacterized protein n=1 Tax=Nesidiocoris tenuis TaxID=355587 RepID=A0ABN7AFJ8_9HEMI|nr:Hypothetical protein NTJ_02463 [Nesidiocoris tenuis]